MNTQSVLTRLFRILHHRSLTLSVVALFLALVAMTLIPEGDYRLQHAGADYLVLSYITAILGFVVCFVGFVNLLRDDKSGYEGFRMSVATLLWALACIPASLLFLMVMTVVIEAYR